ncbi:hybrid sensor histidine kinase/response regulator [Rhodoferax sp.]|uniref:ATP-binding response regulator n=1 Tax=Rhodoferax sp. TaxID=50421 RepID=UPI00271DFC97|nr:hybrid sensor histidine kinase/response regulator [Rhodoferax sp.]MDO8319540.1 hybrid sensor histidine kinase/response regulator [Rhodoferax sp.]
MTAPQTSKTAWFPVFEPEVDHALFLQGYRNLLATGVGQILLAIMVALATHKRADSDTLTLWLVYLVLTGLGYFLQMAYFKDEVLKPGPNLSGVKRWYRHRRTLQIMSSVGWGCISFLMAPEASAHNIYIMTAFAGVVGYSAAGNSANDFPGFVVSALTILLFFIWRLPSVFGDEANALMVMCVFYVAALTLVLRNTHNALRESIRIRLTNEVLAHSNAQQAARAEQANRDKSEFLAAASHDLRQPVHALLLLIEAYRQQVPSAQQHPLMQHITQAGQAINSLFNALMELSRLESGSEKPVLTEFELTATLRDAWQHVLPEAQHRGLRLRSYVAPSLAHTVVRTDPLLLKRIVGNLLSNAMRYTARGGVLLSLRRAHTNGGLWLEVWDTGIGISDDDQKRIFDPYVQLANRERDRTQGLGLGLAIVKHASEMLALDVTLHSTKGRGTCFRIRVPAHLIIQTSATHGPELPRQTQPVAAVPDKPWLKDRRVLLIDDDPLVQQAMQALLRGWQLDVRAASRGDAVLKKCAPNWEPECVLCDYRLPGALNGIEVLDLLLQTYPKTIGVLLTGELAQTVQQAAEDAGYLLLSKPVNASVLAFTLGTLLERRNEERES